MLTLFAVSCGPFWLKQLAPVQLSDVLRSDPVCVLLLWFPLMLVLCVFVQFPEVWQSPWTLFVWPLPVSLSCFDDW